MVDPTTLATEPKFIDMENIIHIGEKWFNARKKNKNFYMLPEEVIHIGQCKTRTQLTK
jgi:hypothetical protein